MKKIIALLLALVMCFALVACGETPAVDNDPVVTDAPASTGNVEAARNYLFNMYKGKVGTIMRDFDVVGSVNIDSVAYAIEWTVAVTAGSAEDVKVVVNENGTVTVDINEKPTEALAFTLTGTVKDAEGKTASVDFAYTVDAIAATGTMYVEAPEVGVPYKFALNQNGLDTPTTLYFTGAKSGNYLATSSNVLDAVDVVWEETEGGYNITFMDGDVKKYVVITTYTKDDGTLNKTQDITTEPGVPFIWDAERGAVVADLGDLGKFYLGTYGTYTTISSSATSYIEDVTKIGVSQFPAGFATVVPTVVEAPEVGKAYLFGLQQNGLETPATLYFTGEMSGNYLATSSNISDAVRVYLEETEGGHYLVFLKDGAKKYINITTYVKDDGSLKNTQKIEDAPATVLVWDAERLTFVGDLGEVGKFYFGTYNTYATISTSNVSYIEDVTKIGVSQFPAGLYDVNLPAEDLNPEPKEEVVVDLSTPAGIMDAAYALEKDTALEGELTLKGKITSVDTPYSEQYKNVTVTIAVDGTDKSIVCFRLKGDGAAELAVGDVITVTGTIKNYNGTVEFDAGCTFTKEGATTEPVEDDKTEEPAKDGKTEETATSADVETVKAAYALEKDAAMDGEQTLTGTITKINTPYSEQYKNVSVTIEIEGIEDKPILCYRLKGDGADKLNVGAVIKVTGNIKNYNGTIEFDAGCTFELIKASDKPLEAVPTNTADIIKAAFALEEDASMTGEVSLKGKITEIKTAYSDQYKNISVVIVVEGFEDKPILCYRMKGNGAENLKVGDVITVTGVIMNYKGTVEFGTGCTFTK